jgi:hypothetical protein
MKIFLAYASQDKRAAESIAFSLRSRGYKVFLDRDDLPAGASYDQRIESAIQDSDIFLFLISPDSVAEGRFTLTELEFARQKWAYPDNHVLPVLARKTPLDDVDPYLKAVTILAPRGDIAAETGAAVDKMRRNTGSTQTQRTHTSGSSPHLYQVIRRAIYIASFVIATTALVAFTAYLGALLPLPEKVEWGPNNGLEPGISIEPPRLIPWWPKFVPWSKLKPELTEKVVQRLARVPQRSDLRLKAGVTGKENLLIEIMADGCINCRVWIGGDPRRDHAFDGLIRIGRVCGSVSEIWSTFQRYTDGSYRKISDPPPTGNSMADALCPNDSVLTGPPPLSAPRQ